jgi:hypothetical protein
MKKLERDKLLRKTCIICERAYAGRSKKLRDFNCEKSDKIKERLKKSKMLEQKVNFKVKMSN